MTPLLGIPSSRRFDSVQPHHFCPFHIGGSRCKSQLTTMNLVLFAPTEIDRPLDLTDDRARHVLKVLRRQVGDEFDVGLINGPRGKARVTALGAERLELDFTWAAPHPPPPSTTVIMGLPRPQTARDILRDATTLGATTLFFVRTARTDPNYASSSLWTTGEWERHLAIGAAQAEVIIIDDFNLPTPTGVQIWDTSFDRSAGPGTDDGLGASSGTMSLASNPSLLATTRVISHPSRRRCFCRA